MTTSNARPVENSATKNKKSKKMSLPFHKPNDHSLHHFLIYLATLAIYQSMINTYLNNNLLLTF